MKKIVCSITAVLLIAFSLQSCKSGSAKSSANTFLTAFYHLDFDGAKKVSTDDTKKMLDMLQQFTPMMPDSTRAQLKKVTVDIKNVAEQGDTSALVTYVTNDNPKDQTLHMVKRNGQWLAQWSKQDSMGGGDQGGQPADQPGAPTDSTSAMQPSAAPADSAATK